MANQMIKYGQSHTSYKVLSMEADNIGGIYDVFTTLIHEWGGEVVAQTRATRTSTKNYQQTFSDLVLRQNGTYKIKWEYVISGVTYTDYEAITVYTPYVTKSEFFDEYAYLDTASNDYIFDTYEQKIRNDIHTYCGQSFEYYPGITFSMDGTGGNALPMPLRVESLTSVIASVSDSTGTTSSDESSYIQVSPDSDWFVEWKNDSIIFKPYAVYSITGDWGWLYVPTNVTQAAKLLIAEEFNQDNEYRRHAVTDLYMDTHRMRIDDKIVWNSTGVIDADVLLMDYVKYSIDWV